MHISVNGLILEKLDYHGINNRLKTEQDSVVTVSTQPHVSGKLHRVFMFTKHFS